MARDLRLDAARPRPQAPRRPRCPARPPPGSGGAAGMTRKKRRLWILVACGVGLGSATALALSAFSDNMVFFVAPSDFAAKAAPGRNLRIGGLVEQGSVERTDEGGKPLAR